MFHSPLRFLACRVAAPLTALLLGVAALPAPAAGPAPGANPPIVFAQSQSDLAADPAAHFGRLSNGMSYVLYRNRTPPGTASVWMRVGAGSIMEQDDQRGLAHFIEHMIFKGSKNVPEGEMVKILQRDGLSFGADTNAQTQAYQTVYQLNLPNASERVVGDALFLMREAAGNVSFKPAAIESERGVILGEERLRSTVGSRASEALLKALLPGTTYAERLPIGKVDVIKTASRDAFLRLYNDFYRPEYTTLIVVGDFNEKRVEAEISRRFSDWHPGPPSGAAATRYGTLTPRNAPEAKVFVADGLPASLQVYWTRPPVDSVETKAKDFADLRFILANSVLNERFGRAVTASDAPFLGAGFQREDLAHTARLYALAIVPKEGQDRPAFDRAMAMLREYTQYGPTQAELDRAMLNFENSLREANASSKTIPTPAIVDQIVDTIAHNTVLQSPAQSLAEFEELKPRLTLQSVAGAIRDASLGDAPLLWRQGKDAKGLDEAGLLAAYQAAQAQTVKAAEARAGVSWPYTDFGTPSKVVSRETLRDADATRVTFANGAVLTVKQTAFEQHGIRVAVEVGNGKLGLQPDQGAALFMAQQLGRLNVGGLGRLSSSDVNEALAGKIVGLNFTVGINATFVTGETTPADLATQLQLMTAFITDPGFRPDALDRLRAALPSSFDAARTSPDGVYFLKASGDDYDGDPRFATPSLADALAVSHASIVALARAQLGAGPIDISVVGDVTPDEAIRQVGATLGAIAPLPAATAAPASSAPRFPVTHLRRVYTHDGRADQNLSVITWPTTDYYADPRQSAALDVLAAVLTGRELEEVRQKQGASYSASASNVQSRYIPGFGFLASRAMVKPDVDDNYFMTVSDIVARLQAEPVSADELNRARLPLVDRLRSGRSTNGYWASALMNTVRDPRQLQAIGAIERNLQSVTAQDVQTLARTYLQMPRALRQQIKPGEGSAKQP